ncbi:MAG: hypothetical protein WBA22_08520 [Candidatus Methanofastidiosia archaeon]
MRLTWEQKKRQFRIIYETLYDTPRSQVSDIATVLNVTRKTARGRLEEAFDMGHIVGPHLKRKSFANFKEYVYLLKCKDPLELYLQYSEDQDIVYHAGMDGFSNLWVISKKEIEVDGLLYSGRRSDYYLSFPPDCSWDESAAIMRQMIREFNSEDYVPQNLIQTHWDEHIVWNDADETLFREFKYNFRRPAEPIARSHHMWSGTAHEWLEHLPRYCTIATYYFPESRAAYDPYLFMFETDYDDFIIDLFSQLPTTSFFFKVSDKLFAYLFVDRQHLRNLDAGVNDVSQLHIPLLIRELKKRKIVRNHARALVAYHWRKDL